MRTLFWFVMLLFSDATVAAAVVTTNTAAATATHTKQFVSPIKNRGGGGHAETHVARGRKRSIIVSRGE